MGSSRVLAVTYSIANEGETAYLPQINISSSNRMPFAKIPPNCQENHEAKVLLCNLNHGQPMVKGASDELSVVYDVSGISGSVMVLTAEVFSTGIELTSQDNVVKDVITLKEFTDIEIMG